VLAHDRNEDFDDVGDLVPGEFAYAGIRPSQ
jgi:hypothetical protein